MTEQINKPAIHLGTFFWRVTASHVISYFVLGLIAVSILDYQGLFSSEQLSCYMKPVDSVWVAAGPLIQLLRGLVFSICLWIVKDQFINQKTGWMKLWIVVAGLCVFTPTGPAPGSIEGFVYTKIPIGDQVIGYLEVLPQTFLFSLGIFYWYENPARWKNITAIVLVLIISLLSAMAILANFYPIENTVQ